MMKSTMLRELLNQPSSSSSMASSSAAAAAASRSGSYSDHSDSDSDSDSDSVSDAVSIVQSVIASNRGDRRTSMSASFLRATTRLHSHLLSLSSSSPSENRELIMKIHALLHSAMIRTEESLKRHLLSISAVDFPSRDKIAMIRSIAETMLATGYGKECVSAYQSIRRSNLNSQMVRLKFDPSLHLPRSIRKHKWEVLDRRIKSWTHIATAVVQPVLSNERKLCEEIFFASSTESVRDQIFASIACDTALGFLSFPATVAVHLKPSPEKVFRLLDMYTKLSNLLPDIDFIFMSEQTSAVRSQVVSSLAKLSESIRAVMSTFEVAIQKDPLNPSGLPGGAVHPLTRYVMNYLAYLSDFELHLHEILVDVPPNCSPVFFKLSTLKDESIVSVTIAWVLFVLLCKIDSKAEGHSNVALSYLFLANNLRYIVTKVQSCPLKDILGTEWVSEHNTKARRFMEGHVRSGWAHMSAMLPTKNTTTGDDVEQLRGFEVAFEKALQERKDWVIADAGMREEVGMTVEALLVPAYREWYRAQKDSVDVLYSPEDVKQMIMRYYGQ